MDTKYNDVKRLAQNRSLVVVDNKIFLWQYPPEIFKLFKHVYIMTYICLKQAQSFRCYFETGIILTTELKGLTNDSKLCAYQPHGGAKYKKLINILQNEKMNDIGSGKHYLSSTWFKSSYNKEKIIVLKKNVYNYFRNIVNGANRHTIMWTVFEDL